MASQTKQPLELPPALIERMRTDHAMRQLTRDELVQELWSTVENGQSEAHFVLDAQIQWRAEKPSWHEVSLAQISPDAYDPPGSGPKYVMPKMSTHFACKVTTEPLNRKNPAHGKAVLRQALRNGQVVSDVMSVLAAQPVRLRLARRFEMSWSEDDQPLRDPPTPRRGTTQKFIASETNAERTSTVIDDKWVESGLKPFLRVLTSIPDVDVRHALERAIDWHAQANALHGMGRYIHYWAAIELLGTFFYDYLDPRVSNRPTNAERELSVLRQILNLNGDNYREVIDKCAKMLEPSAREKILRLADIVRSPEKPDLRKLLFEKADGRKGKPEAGARSLYDIRNDIAHGNVSPLFREYWDQHHERFEQFQRVSLGFILDVLNLSHSLCQHRAQDYAAGSPSVDK